MTILVRQITVMCFYLMRLINSLARDSAASGVGHRLGPLFRGEHDSFIRQHDGKAIDDRIPQTCFRITTDERRSCKNEFRVAARASQQVFNGIIIELRHGNLF